MKVKVYVNWSDEEILSEKEYQDKVREAVEDVMNDGDAFSQACKGEFDALELFYMDSTNENDIERVKSILEEYVKDDLNLNGWDEIKLEI